MIRDWIIKTQNKKKRFTNSLKCNKGTKMPRMRIETNKLN